MIDIEKLYEQMYEFENNSQLYEFRFEDTKVPMWMYIRSWFIGAITDKIGEKESNDIWKEKMSRPFIKKSVINKYVIRNPFLSHTRDYLLLFGDIVNCVSTMMVLFMKILSCLFCKCFLIIPRP